MSGWLSRPLPMQRKSGTRAGKTIAKQKLAIEVEHV
jgi:hypothetical protein